MTSDPRSSARKITLEAIRKHIILQGEVLYAANLLQDSFYELFSIALGLERPDRFGAEVRFHNHALAIWHVIQSDNQQREMALAAISTIPTKLKLPEAISRLVWAKNRANKLAEYRNIIAHTPIMFRGRQKGKALQFIPAFGAHSTKLIHKRRLSLIKNLRFWNTLRNDLFNLKDYVDALNQQVRRLDVESRGAEMVGVPHTWPSKPRLRSVRRIQEIDQILKPEVPPPKRRNRRRS